MAVIDVELPEPMQGWIKSRVDSGLYADASDYVRDLIRHDQSREAKFTRAAHIDALIGEALADVEAGRVYDAGEVFEEVEAAIREVELQKTA